MKISDQEDFFKATRMTVEKFNTLLVLLTEKLQRYSRRAPIAPETRLGLTLLYLSQGCGPQFLAWSHKMGASTVRQVVYDTCEAIWSELHDIYVAKPNVRELRNIADRFYAKTGMPHCLGAIDGKHVNIVRPINSGSLFFNYKKTFSIVLLATCDSNYTFTYVDVGALGSQSDGGVLSKSAFGKMILRAELDIPSQDYLPGSNINSPYFFVGDSAFPLKPNLMRPNLMRVHIENAFGILSKRWRVLHKPIHAAPKNVDKIILATIVLHNYLMLDRDPNYFNENLVDHEVNGSLIPGTCRDTDTSMNSVRIGQTNRSSEEAFNLRETIANYLTATNN
ncbi:PREDICTED: uncharacterized protein LOC108360066 [Rhagoletis zephyria]|uniref:uncharacterized protein LOC108360066 n=1 Tax=Rhagoletis zephyria TaxID=28612 RepID=UPI0008117D5F|nr:PREDICTED: uncharacterized protein LOC108360066 [Rhagoletis zephyria]